MKKEGHIRMIIAKVLWWILFAGYLYMVLFVTVLGRAPGVLGSGTIMPLFSSYINAWKYSLYHEWKNIFLNYLMFVPFGFWLGIGSKSLRKLWKILLLAFTFSLIIETTQLYTSRGIFELDDIMGNTIGAGIGFGIFSIFSTISRKLRGKKK